MEQERAAVEFELQIGRMTDDEAHAALTGTGTGYGEAFDVQAYHDQQARNRRYRQHFQNASDN
jgi:hypothetical protein